VLMKRDLGIWGDVASLSDVAGATGQPPAKRLRESPPVEALEEGTRAQLTRFIVAALQESGVKDGVFVEGSRLSQMLMASEEMRALVAKAKEAYAGKGWLVKLLSTEPAIRRVAPEGKDEPCFQLAEGADLASAGQTETMLDFGLPPAEKLASRRQPKGNSLPSGTVLQVVPPGKAAELPAELQEAAAALVQRAIEALSQAALEDGNGCLAGNTLSRILLDEMADVSRPVRESLGNKGWLKKLLASEEQIQQVVVQGKYGMIVDEPCYRLTSAGAGTVYTGLEAQAGQEPTAPKFKMTRTSFAAAPVGGKAMTSKGGWNFGKGKVQIASPHYMGLPFALAKGKPYGAMAWTGKGVSRSGLFKVPGVAKGLAKAAASPSEGGGKGAEKSIEEMPLEVQQSVAVLQESARLQLQTSDIAVQGYVQGNKLSTLLSELQPDAVAAVKPFLSVGGRSGPRHKGWLKRLLADVPGVEMVSVDGIDEPCYSYVG